MSQEDVHIDTRIRSSVRCLWDSQVDEVWRQSDMLLGAQETEVDREKLGSFGTRMVMKALAGHSFIPCPFTTAVMKCRYCRHEDE